MSGPTHRAAPRSSFAAFAKDGAYVNEVERSVDFLNVPHEFFIRAKGEALLEIVQRHVGDPSTLSFLDVGCGVGSMQRYVAAAARKSVGVDMSAESVETARATYPGVEFHAYSGERLPFDDGAFDVVFAVNVMRHVPPAQWPAFSQELMRVVRPGGVVCVFEHDPYNPLTRLAVFRCEFDDDAVLLTHRKLLGLLTGAGGVHEESRYILFFPFKASFTAPIERRLKFLPLGAQHCVAVRRQLVPSGV